jgi:hypothetical protein
MKGLISSATLKTTDVDSTGRVEITLSISIPRTRNAPPFRVIGRSSILPQRKSVGTWKSSCPNRDVKISHSRLLKGWTLRWGFARGENFPGTNETGAMEASLGEIRFIDLNGMGIRVGAVCDLAEKPIVSTRMCQNQRWPDLTGREVRKRERNEYYFASCR